MYYSLGMLYIMVYIIFEELYTVSEDKACMSFDIFQLIFIGSWETGLNSIMKGQPKYVC